MTGKRLNALTKGKYMMFEISIQVTYGNLKIRSGKFRGGPVVTLLS